GRAVFTDRPDEEAEHVDLALLMHRLDREDVARGVVEQGMYADGLLDVLLDDERRCVADVAVPERPGSLGLPAEALLAIGAVAERAPIQSTRGEEAADGGRGDRVLVDAPLGHEGSEDQLGRSAGVLSPDLADERLLLGREGTRGASVGA